MNKIKTKLKKGDNVLVVSGKDKGKSGSILSIFPITNKAIASMLPKKSVPSIHLPCDDS